MMDHENLSPDVANYIGKKGTIHLERKPIDHELQLPTIDKLPKELVVIAEKIAHISGTWNPVEIYTADPSSIESEKKKIFNAYDNGEEYNPTLTYSYAKSLDLRDARTKLVEQLHVLRNFGIHKKSKWKFWDKDKLPGKQTMDRTTRIFRSALYFKIKDDLATCDLVEGIKKGDEDKISTALKQKYPGTDQSLYDLAVEGLTSQIFNNKSADNSKGVLTDDEVEYLEELTFNAQDIKSAFEWTLSQYGILYTESNRSGFKVKIDKSTTSIDVRDKSANGPTIFIPEGRVMSGARLLAIIAHEIEGHARQSINGELLFKIGGGKLKIDNEQLYEGLGMRYETNIEKRLFGINNSAPEPYFVFGTKMAEEGNSFFKIFQNQVELRLRVKLKIPLGQDLPPLNEIDSEVLTKAKNSAWLITYRVMRGHLDMSNKKKFAMSKDLGYLRGYQMDSQLVNNGLGYINEEGVIASGALALLAEFNLSEKNLPIPFKDLATKYWLEVLKPRMEAEKIQKQI